MAKSKDETTRLYGEYMTLIPLEGFVVISPLTDNVKGLGWVSGTVSVSHSGMELPLKLGERPQITFRSSVMMYF